MTKKIGRFKFFFSGRGFMKFYFFASALIILSVFTACRTPPKIDMRKLAPNDAIVYLEIGNLAATLESLTESRAFQELAAETPDFSALENVQMAVAVTGFETSEKQVSDDNAVLDFKPQFVVIAETHAWSWQTLALAENQINNFVIKNFGQETQLEKVDKFDGKFFTWTAADNRKIFAFVQDSLIYFGNDQAAIEKCLAVKNNKAESLLKNESLERSYSTGNSAFGYVSPAGIAQIANLAAVGLAVQTTEESGGRSFIAGVLPQILQNTTKEIVWTANKTERGIEDKFSVSLTPEVSAVVKETLATAEQTPAGSIEFLPPDFFSATRYNLRNPLIAWRSLLLVTAQNADTVSGKFLIEVSDSLLEPYGIAKAEDFLSQIDSEIITAQFDAEGERSAAIFRVKVAENLKTSISKEINFKAESEKKFDAEIWFSEDKKTAAAFIENNLILGESESVLKCLQAKQSGQNFAKNPNYQKVAASQFVAATFARDLDSAGKIVEVLAKKKDTDRKLATFYLTETRFTDKGIERKTVSDFGLIGTILKQFSN